MNTIVEYFELLCVNTLSKCTFDKLESKKLCKLIVSVFKAHNDLYLLCRHHNGYGETSSVIYDLKGLYGQ